MRKAIRSYIDDQITADLRKRTLAGTRADGRDLTTVRDIQIDIKKQFQRIIQIKAHKLKNK